MRAPREMPEPWTLAAFLAGRHPRHCEENSWDWLQKREPPRVAYLAVARTGSESLQKAVGSHHKRHAPHDHACTLRDVESAGATHVLISLRHPAERIASGVKRRLEGISANRDSEQNADFRAAFLPYGSAALNAFVASLRDPAHPLHARAMHDSMRQNWLTPVSEFYLANGHLYDRAARRGFVCTPTLADDVWRVTKAWGVKGVRVQAKEASSHRSNTTLAPLSAENRAWVESTWAADVALWNTYCAATARSDRVEANAPVWGELLPARKPHQVTTTAPESLHEIHG